jgi:membrane fusion protein, multidrug efflux system
VKSSNIIAATVVLVVTVWMLSGMLPGDTQETETKTDSAEVHELTRVQVVAYQAHPMQREVVVQGQSQAKYEVLVKVETTGQVKQVVVEKGNEVRRGETVLRLEADERTLQLEEARALVAQRNLEFEAAKKLKKQGLQTEIQLAQAVTLLNSAKTYLKVLS